MLKLLFVSLLIVFFVTKSHGSNTIKKRSIHSYPHDNWCTLDMNQLKIIDETWESDMKDTTFTEVLSKTNHKTINGSLELPRKCNNDDIQPEADMRYILNTTNYEDMHYFLNHSRLSSELNPYNMVEMLEYYNNPQKYCENNYLNSGITASNLICYSQFILKNYIGLDFNVTNPNSQLSSGVRNFFNKTRTNSIFEKSRMYSVYKWLMERNTNITSKWSSILTQQETSSQNNYIDKKNNVVDNEYFKSDNKNPYNPFKRTIKKWDEIKDRMTTRTYLPIILPRITRSLFIVLPKHLFNGVNTAIKLYYNNTVPRDKTVKLKEAFDKFLFNIDATMKRDFVNIKSMNHHYNNVFEKNKNYISWFENNHELEFTEKLKLINKLYIKNRYRKTKVFGFHKNYNQSDFLRLQVERKQDSIDKWAGFHDPDPSYVFETPFSFLNISLTFYSWFVGGFIKFENLGIENPYNTSGCLGRGFPYLPEETLNCKYPVFSVNDISFWPTGFNPYASGQCTPYRNPITYFLAIIHIPLTPYLWKIIHIDHPGWKPYFGWLVNNATGLGGFRAVPPESYVCIGTNSFILAVLLSVVALSTFIIGLILTMVTNVEEKLFNRTPNRLVRRVVSGFKWVGGKLVDGAKYAGKKIGSAASAVGSGLKKRALKLTKGYRGKSNSSPTSNTKNE